MDKKTVIAHETHEVAQYFETPYMTAMTYEYDEEMKTLEMLQMPELSSGRYVHDFFKKKTLIVDSGSYYTQFEFIRNTFIRNTG